MSHAVPIREVRDAGVPVVDQVLTLKEIAAQLELAEEDVQAMAEAGAMPVSKVRGEWRIKQSELDRWRAMQSPSVGGGGRGL